jgi:hypothetical protein
MRKIIEYDLIFMYDRYHNETIRNESKFSQQIFCEFPLSNHHYVHKSTPLTIT